MKRYLLDTNICIFLLRGMFDLWIGCAAITYGMVMVTENVKDFQNFMGIQIENWIQR